MGQMERVAAALQFQGLPSLLTRAQTFLLCVRKNNASVTCNPRITDRFTATLSLFEQLADFLDPSTGPDMYLIFLDADHLSSL